MPVRPIFLVHGVGTQKRGQFLAEVVEPWIQFLIEELGSEAVSFEVELRPAEGPARARISFGTEEWLVWEAFWAESFDSLKPDRVLIWGFQILRFHIWSMFKGIVPPLRDHNAYPRTSDEVYQRSIATHWTGRLYDILVGIPAIGLFSSLFLPVLLIASIFFAFSQLPLGVISERIQGASVRLVSAFVEGMGDFAAILLSHAQFAAIQGQLKSLLLEQMPSDVDHATIIAHSGGTAVSYPVIADPTTWDALGKTNRKPNSVSFLTFGSSLNLAWRIRKNHRNQDHRMWDNSLPDQVKWVDFWARYDPVSHGPPIPAMKVKVRGPNGGGYEEVRVVNNDNPFSDHGAYWGNHPEVVSRMVYEIAQVQPGQTPLGKAIQDALNGIEGHRRRIGTVNLTTVLVAVMVVTLIGLADIVISGNPISQLGSAVLQFLIPEPTDSNGLWQRFIGLQEFGPIKWIVGSASIIAGVDVLWQILRLWRINRWLTRKYG